ncbi:hypothetical protein D9611_013487 [Ephemerocybe angulata]|uniref:Uncharacterized protein n=1 Tax=Ephemerocybe angulata TaxID=980116 RepID=A0A8H5BTF4_9AGAR|nr:hypothetical protein D9611_013487 [Tulosesus angulatus]
MDKIAISPLSASIHSTYASLSHYAVLLAFVVPPLPHQDHFSISLSGHSQSPFSRLQESRCAEMRSMAKVSLVKLLELRGLNDSVVPLLEVLKLDLPQMYLVALFTPRARNYPRYTSTLELQLNRHSPQQGTSFTIKVQPPFFFFFRTNLTQPSKYHHNALSPQAVRDDVAILCLSSL